MNIQDIYTHTHAVRIDGLSADANDDIDEPSFSVPSILFYSQKNFVRIVNGEEGGMGEMCSFLANKLYVLLIEIGARNVYEAKATRSNWQNKHKIENENVS